MALQSNVLEFIVSGSLDGVTANPEFQRANAVVPRPTPPGEDQQNIYQFEVQNLGIVDLTFPGLLERPDGPVAKGNRFIPWLLIDTGGVIGPGGSGVSVAAFRPGSSTPIVQETPIDLGGEVGIYSKRCIFVPHGSALRLGPGISAMGGVPIIVRFAVLLPFTRTQEELINKACCCVQGINNTTPTTCLDPPNPESVDPVLVAQGTTPQTLTVNGTGFQDGDQVTIPGLVVTGTTFVDETELQADFIPEETGTFDVGVTRPGEENCTGTISEALTVF